MSEGPQGALKACPGCGETMLMNATHGPRYTLVGCPECGFSVDTMDEPDKDARLTWNRRAPDARLLALRDALLATTNRLRMATMRGYANQDDAVACERELSLHLHAIDALCEEGV